MSKVGKIEIAEEIVLAWLDFSGANIVNSSYNCIEKTLTIMLESPEINVKEFGSDIRPSYIKETDSMGHFIVKREKLDNKIKTC